MKTISILGSTGSIGVQTLDVVQHLGNIRVAGLAAGKNIKLLAEQIIKFKPEIASVKEEQDAAALKNLIGNCPTQILWGEEGAKSVATIPQSELVVCAIVGAQGLTPTIHAIENGKTIALANKETLVAAGSYVMRLAKEKNVKILPVDSEHYAIKQCLEGSNHGEIRRLIITASGGAFFGKTADELQNITPAEACKHPNWSMGKKITVDSSTLMNKALEVIEAHHLFNIPFDKIDVVVHRESIIHSMVEFVDGSVIAQLAAPDMRLPIQAAITYPEKKISQIKTLDLTEIGKLTFYKPDYETFQCLNLGIKAGKIGGSMPAVMNIANEIAVAQFLNSGISFLEIPKFIKEKMNEHKLIKEPTIKEILSICEAIVD